MRSRLSISAAHSSDLGLIIANNFHGTDHPFPTIPNSISIFLLSGQVCFPLVSALSNSNRWKFRDFSGNSKLSLALFIPWAFPARWELRWDIPKFSCNPGCFLDLEWLGPALCEGSWGGRVSCELCRTAGSNPGSRGVVLLGFSPSYQRQRAFMGWSIRPWKAQHPWSGPAATLN